MDSMSRQIKAIQDKLKDLPDRLTVTYKDGSSRKMSAEAAITEVLKNGAEIAEVTQKAGNGRLGEILQTCLEVER